MGDPSIFLPMGSTSYKGFEITVRPYQVHETGEWTVDVDISRRGRKRSFSTQEHFATQAEAVARSLAFGRNIIDGKLPDSSVDSLR